MGEGRSIAFPLDAFHAQHETLRAMMPRGMPSDFAPDVAVKHNSEIGLLLVATARGEFPDGTVRKIRLAIPLGDDESLNGKAMKHLWQSLWQAVELARLGQDDDLANLIGGL